MMYQKAIDPNEFLKQMKAKQEQEEVCIRLLAGGKICFKIERTDKDRVADSDSLNPDASFYLTIHRFYVTNN
jgi:hypothetical protein